MNNIPLRDGVEEAFSPKRTKIECIATTLT